MNSEDTRQFPFTLPFFFLPIAERITRMFPIFEECTTINDQGTIFRTSSVATEYRGYESRKDSSVRLFCLFCPEEASIAISSPMQEIVRTSLMAIVVKDQKYSI